MTRTAARRSRLTPRLAVAVTAFAVAVALLVAGLLGALSGPSPVRPVTPGRAVDAFFTTYMRPDGRVVRTDQGGDTVSEGQAYAMLMAAALDERHRFDLAWGWTESHLMRPDGLLAWRWAGGAVTGHQPASDADVGAAAALVVAARRFSDPAFLGDARRLAASIVSQEVAPSAQGPTLVAGPWARQPTEYVDPSYLSPEEIDDLAGALGGTWYALAGSASAELMTLTAGGTLPSDWAVTSPGGRVRPANPPSPSGAPVRFGFDAARAPIWMAASCSGPLRSAAAGLLPALQRGGGEVELDLGGRPAPGVRHPVGLLAEAAGEYAAGRTSAAWALVNQARRDNAAHPSYYGSAWVALTAIDFDHLLQPCS